MVGQSGLKVCALAAWLAWAGAAAAHGKAVAAGAMEDAAKAFGPGARLTQLDPAGKPGAIAWYYAAGKDGARVGLVGVAKEETEHGYLAQATCLDMEKKIIAVILLRAMADEQGALARLTQTPRWWEPGAVENPSGAALVLIKSVRKVKDAAAGVP